MPLLYGEGDNAFIRLQEEIMRSTWDHSILASGYGLPCPDPGRFLHLHKEQRSVISNALPFPGEINIYKGSQEGFKPETFLQFKDRTPACLSKSPDAFRGWDQALRNLKGRNHYLPTNLGIYIGLDIISFKFNEEDYGLALLHCGLVDRNNPLLMALPLRLHRSNSVHTHVKDTILAARPNGIVPFLISIQSVWSIPNVHVYLASSSPPIPSGCRFWTFEIQFDFLSKFDYYLADFFPPCLARIDTGRLILEDSSICPRIFRFCHPKHETILLLMRPEPTLRYNTTELKVATITDTLTSWQLVLPGPRFDKVDFARLQKSLVWISKGILVEMQRKLSEFDFAGEVQLDLSEIKALPSQSIPPSMF
ncbi:hypothetical protein F4781DRAFT_312990 [Annulohypoxylon bovei var. microspora]|nr:hypothetical protein F4781DRAFT_312990 [Annulohypoxylon bovei var. microspora]